MERYAVAVPGIAGVTRYTQLVAHFFLDESTSRELSQDRKLKQCEAIGVLSPYVWTCVGRC